jgi:hypothetical protein
MRGLKMAGSMILAVGMWAGSSFALSDTDTVRTFVPVSSIATFSNPSVASRAYAVVDSAVYFSGNSGVAWTACSGTCPPAMKDASQDRLCPGNGYVFAIAGNEVYRAGIGSNTWQLLFSQNTYGSGKFDQRAMASTGNSVFFLATDTVSKSLLIMKATTADGNSFGDFLTGWDAKYGSAVTGIFSDSTGVAVSTSAGYTLTTADGATSWTPKYSPAVLASDSNYSFGVLARMGTVLIGARNNGIRRATAASGTNEACWSALITIADSVKVLSLASSGPKLFAGTTRGPYVSDDTGTTWSKTGGPAIAGLAVSAVGACQGSMLAGTVTKGVYRSTDGGTTFAADTNGIPGYSEKYTITHYVQAIPKPGERRRFVHFSSGYAPYVPSRSETYIDIVTVDSVLRKGSDTTLIFITTVDSLLDTVAGWTWHGTRRDIITVAGFGWLSKCTFPQGIFGRYSDSGDALTKVKDSTCMGHEAFWFSSASSIFGTDEKLFADSIGLSLFFSTYSTGRGGSTDTYSLVPDDSLISAVKSVGREKAFVWGNAAKVYTRLIGPGARIDAFLLNGRRGSWKTGAMTVVVKKERPGKSAGRILMTR